MTTANKIRSTTVMLLLVFFSFSSTSSEVKGERPQDLLFHIKAVQSQFEEGSEVALEFSLKNISQRRVLATRAASLNDLIYLNILDERGQRVGWTGKIPSRGYPSDFFVILEPGQVTTFRAVIASANGSGYEIKKLGAYRVRAMFSLSPREYFAPVSDGAFVPAHPIKSNWVRFSVVASGSGQRPRAE